MDLFEKKYMEKSWQKKAKKSYRISAVDKSVVNFYNFIKLKKGNFLDLGCGNGRNTLFFSKKGFDSMGIDFSPSAIKICKRKSSKEKFVSGDVLEYPFLKYNYDVVLDAGCLHHIRKKYWSKYRKNLLKTIKKDGYFYLHGISDCKENKKLPKHPKKRKWVLKNGHYTGFFSKKDIVDFFGRDFKLLKTYQYQSEPLMVRVFYFQKK